MLAWEETKQANPCIPSDHTGIYEYGGLSYDLVAAPSGASFEACGKLVTLVLKQDLDCGAPAVRRSESLKAQTPPEMSDGEMVVDKSEPNR